MTNQEQQELNAELFALGNVEELQAKYDAMVLEQVQIGF